MTLFLDASAFVAMIAGEPETVSGLRLSYAWTVEAARNEVDLVVSQLPFRLVPIGEEQRTAALDAYQRFGKGTGHPARLNMGDCFAYACAKTSAARLLYKGDDFHHTDLK